MAKVLAVCISQHVGMPKEERECAQIGKFGLVGDYHNREMRPSFRHPGTMKPNVDRQVSLVAHEVIQEMNELLDLEMEDELVFGSLGENITTDGLGDLSQLLPGTRLQIGEKVILRVTEQNEPCKNLYKLHRLLVKKIYGKRGILCAIEEGVDSYIFVGDEIKVLSIGEGTSSAA